MIVGTGDTVGSKGICKKMVLSFSGLTVTMYFLLLELGLGSYRGGLKEIDLNDWPRRYPSGDQRESYTHEERSLS